MLETAEDLQQIAHSNVAIVVHILWTGVLAIAVKGEAEGLLTITVWGGSENREAYRIRTWTIEEAVVWIGIGTGRTVAEVPEVTGDGGMWSSHAVVVELHAATSLYGNWIHECIECGVQLAWLWTIAATVHSHLLANSDGRCVAGIVAAAYRQTNSVST